LFSAALWRKVICGCLPADSLEVQLNTAAKQPSAVLPIVMSLAALATVFVHITVSGTQPQADEGTAAHVWQLLMAGQLPIMLFYAIKWIPRTRQKALAGCGKTQAETRYA